MDKKYSEYESLFVFQEENVLQEHLKTCKECKQEHELMQKISTLISEVQPHYLKKEKNKFLYKVACILCLFVATSFTIGMIYNDEDFYEILQYGDTLTAEELGLPVDDYGLVVVD